MKYLNLWQIKMPINAIVSILHRVSGFILILSLPIITYLFAQSLLDNQGFMLTKNFISHLGIIQSLIIWSFAHHIIAGIRFLLIDIEIGVFKKPAKISSILVLILSGLIFLILLTNLIL